VLRLYISSFYKLVRLLSKAKTTDWKTNGRC
jgi:hypothetical protein